MSQLKLRWLWVLLLCTAFEWPGRLAHLEYELTHAPPAARRDAVKRLSTYAPDEVRESLLAALEDDDVQVRKAAAAAVARTQVKEAAPLLAAWLGDRDAEVRGAAVTALGVLAEPSSREALTRALSDALPAVRREAAGALAQIADDEALLALQATAGDADPSVREAAISALRGHADGRALPALSARVTDESPAVRAAVLRTLGSLSDARALPLLARAAEAEHDDVELAAVQALGELGAHVEAIGSSLLAVLRKKLDADPRVAKAAVAAIGRLKTAAAVAALVDTLENTELALAAQSALAERMRRAAGSPEAQTEGSQLSAALARALEKTQNPETADVIADLIAAVSDVMPTASLQPAIVAALETGRGDAVRLSRALATTASPDALVPLLERLSALAPSAPAPASPAEQTSDLPRGTYAASLPRSELSADRAATNIQAANLPPLVLTVGTTASPAPITSPQARVETGDELNGLLDALLDYSALAPSDGRAADPLLRQLSAAMAPGLRVKLIKLLGWTAAARALPALQREIANPSLDVQLAAIDAIGRIDSPDGVSTIAPLLQAPRSDVRLTAARAYGQLAREPALMQLLEQLDGRGAADRIALLTAAGFAAGHLYATQALSEQAIKRTLRTLGNFVGNGDLELSATALDALRHFGHERAASIVARELLSPKLSRRAAATFALSDFPGEETRRLLRFVLQRSAPRASMAALLALGEVGDQRDTAALLRIARFGRWPLPAAATFALRRIAERPEVKKRALERSLCELTSLSDPYARANATSALAALGGSVCPDLDLGAGYAASEPSVLRSATARWMRARAEQTPQPEPALLQSLAVCSSDPDPLVRAACAPSRNGVAGSEQPQAIDLIAYDSDGRTPMRQRLVALRFSDASTFVGYTDANARLHLPRAPAGPVVLEDPGE